MKISLKSLVIISLFCSASVFADPTVINNNYSSTNNNNQAPNAGNNCNANNTAPANSTPPGMSVQNYSDGTSSNVYSTGTKNPYIVDNNCNNNNNVNTPVIQPYIFPGRGPRR